jgi:CheY-like chemotaxis protein
VKTITTHACDGSHASDGAADDARDALLAVLGHELRNPLAPMRNAVHLLREPHLPPEKRERALAIIDRQLAHLTRLVEDLVDGSRLARGRLVVQDQEVDLTRVVHDEVEDLRGVADERGVAVELELPRAPVMVRGDPVRLAQVVATLVQNGLRFSERGGKVWVRLESAPPGRATVRVADDGVGMTYETLSRLFEPFATTDHGLARTRAGLGMGLAIVRGVIELHGGAIHGESGGVGKGSTFTFDLPLARTRSAAAKPYGSARRRTERRRVLVVEDNADSAVTLAELLSLRGHEVGIAEDGPRALAEARRLKPDVVVCDVGLPGQMDGYAVARAIRADASLGPTVLLALSGYTTMEHRKRALEAGFDAHLAKPADLEELYRLIEGR